MKDILTPRERFGMLVIDEKPDRCPVIPLITSHAATVAGIKLKRYYTNGERMAKAQITAFEIYQHDAISIFSEVGLIAEAMGSEFNYPDDDLPVLKKPALLNGLHDKIIIPNPRKSKRLPVYLEAIKYAYRSVGDIVPILAYIPAPFTTGMHLLPPEKFLIETLKRPDGIKIILDTILDVTKEFCFEVINAGALPIIVDPLASGSVISPAIYKDVAMIYEQKLIDYLHRFDFDVILHICGDTSPLLEYFLQTSADLISLDRVNMLKALDKLSHKIRLIGNFDTTTLLLSNPEEIHKTAGMMVEQLKFARKGYIVSTGCEVPIKTPRENVMAFIKAGKEKGWYWV
ncbi:MAG: uroporphyrinogen decarboxylase family protein [candidate division WOR-3 bacterium]|nr:uroporphyrinogen decarboxylase family protein [candidate division WOR-3 bacterium]